ncbi:MAG TPA: hypothetical protein VN201_00915 [Roseateles sp.]|nr:hypothetical protein [Roseateles sp.]
MTDRELLEKAAKAAGLKDFAWFENNIHGHGYPVLGHITTPWNPLEDDGDALRLAYTLKLNNQPQKTMGGVPAGFNVWPAGRGDCAAVEDGNAIKDLRRAIVSAAAAMASATPNALHKLTGCAAGKDGDCTHSQCPQLRDGEPKATGRHCPLDA